MVPDIPIACSLSEPELRERRATVLAAFDAHVRKVESRFDGYVIELEPTDEAIAAATAVIVAEGACCPFLRFELTVDVPAKRTQLVLSGPPGTREFLATWLEPRAARAEPTGGAQ
jgi:hypothetical protein